MNSCYNLDEEILSKELILLIEILKTANQNKPYFEKNGIFESVNWEYFLKLAIHHRVQPIVYMNLKDIDNIYIPSFVIETLEQAYKQNIFHMLKLSGEMEKISKLFIQNDIRLIFLKGPILAMELYGNISLRVSRDLDILISIDDIEKIDELLTHHGYERKEILTPLWKLRNHHVTYSHLYNGCVIEIHWRLHPHSINEPRFDELWKRKRVKKITRFSFYFLGEEDLFLYLVAHGARHGWFRLRWLLDTRQFLHQHLGEDSIILKKFDYRHLWGRVGYLGQALILVSALFNEKFNRELESLMQRNDSKKWAKNTLKYISQQTQFDIGLSKKDFDKSYNRYLFSTKSKLEKLIFILSLLYPNPQDAKVLILPKSLWFMYIPLRPFLWLWRKKKNL